MIDGSAGRRIGIRAERLSDQTAYKKMMRFSKAREAHPIVTLIIRKRRQEPRIGVFETFTASHIGD